MINQPKQAEKPGEDHYVLLVAPGHSLFVIQLTGLLTLKLQGYEN